MFQRNMNLNLIYFYYNSLQIFTIRNSASTMLERNTLEIILVSQATHNQPVSLYIYSKVKVYKWNLDGGSIVYFFYYSFSGDHPAAMYHEHRSSSTIPYRDPRLYGLVLLIEILFYSTMLFWKLVPGLLFAD